MNIHKRKVFASMLSLSAVSSLVLPTFTMARTIDATASNQYTQSNSYNYSESNIVETIIIKNKNEASVENYIDQQAYTGNNTASSVNGDVSINTGDATTSASVENQLNYNETSVDGGADVDVSTANSNTQSFSENYAYGTYDSKVKVENINELEVENEVNQIVDTGYNTIQYVNGDSDLTTGEADLEADVSTSGNINETEVSASTGASLSATNDMTQSYSFNYADSYLESDIKVKNKNDASVKNKTYQEGYSGYNYIGSINGDVDAGHTTGDVTMESNTSTDVNYNTTNVGMNYGDAEIITSNRYTQSGSENIAYGTLILGVDVDNDNNLKVYNHHYMYGESGANTLQDVNGDVDLTTGEVDGESNLETTGNQNETEITGLGDFSSSAMNEYTQSDSFNYADSYVELELEVENDNDARVKNHSDIYGYTGYNWGWEINGDVDLESGDVDLATSAYTDLNYNWTTIENGLGDIEEEASNSNTQSDSENYAYANVDLKLKVENDNDTHERNHFSGIDDTGWNWFYDVNGDADLNTGEADSGFDIMSTGNMSETTI